MTKHPTTEQLRRFYHDKWEMENIGWIFLHIIKCRKCSRKFANLKVKYKSKHKKIEYKNFKDLSPEAIEKVKVCYGACVFISWRLDAVSTLEDIRMYSNAIEMLEEDIEIKNGERYLQYKSWEEGWEALSSSASWLSEMVSDSERFFLFRDLARIIILTWDQDDYRKKLPMYLSDQNIECIAENLGLVKNLALGIAEEELWDVQKFWHKYDREKSNVR
jgi:hypothetical protein